MNITRLNQAPKVPFDLDGHILANHADVEIIHLHLKPGERIEKHTNPFDVIFYILEGKAMLESDLERVLVMKDHSIVIDAGVNRGIENISVGDFRLLVIKLHHTKK
ncbi:MAG: cupin domain-containing protein [Bacteroidota bacterium]